MKSISFALLLAASLPLSAQEPFPLGGLVHDPSADHPEWCHQGPAVNTKALPASVDLAVDMPPVGSQTGNSCTGWSVGYYFKSHQEKVERGWDLADPGHQFSPMFLYNQLNSGVDGGADLFDALELMWAHGCATVSQMASNCGYTQWPTETAFDSALLYRCQQSGQPYFVFGSDAGISYAKQLLAENKCLVFNIGVFGNFDAINSYDTTYCAADSFGNSRGRHNLCAVGYDDDKATNDGTGAFRCVNSWGTGWGNQGYWWLSYHIVRDHHQMVYQWAGYVPDTTGYQPALKARVRVSHSRRGRIEMIAGIGTPASPLWSKAFYVKGSGLGQYVYTGGDQPFPATNMVLDLSDGAPYLDSTASNEIFFGCIDRGNDGVAGSIEHFSVEYLPWSASAASADPPQAIPNYNSYAYCTATLSKPTGVAGKPAAFPPPGFSLAEAQPNPCRGLTQVRFQLPAGAPVAVAVYNILGQEVKRLDMGTLPAGSHIARLDLAGAVPGLYFCRLTAGKDNAIRRLVLVK